MTFWVAGAVVGSAVIGSMASGKAAGAQADAANNATAAQSASADKAAAIQKEMFDKQIELQAPFREAGLTGQNRLMDLLGLSGRSDAQGYGSAATKFGMSDFQADPGYQWRLQQGQQALDRSAAARGGMFSGRAMKDAMNFGQGAASQEYGNAYNRFQTDRAGQINPLQSLAGQAQTGANTLGGAAQNYGNSAVANFTSLGNNQANNLLAAGNANASGYMGTANAISGGIGQGLNLWQNQNMMNRFFPSGGTGVTYPGVDASSTIV